MNNDTTPERLRAEVTRLAEQGAAPRAGTDEPEGFTQGVDAAAAMLDKMADDLFANACRYPLLVRGAAKPLVVRRVAKRQSCLWRHSFDWHNRRRGHPTHRSA